MVKAADRPLSCTKEQDSLRQIVPSSAKPSVSHLVSLGFRQICSRVRSRAVSWSCLNLSFLIRQKSVNILEASTPGQREIQDKSQYHLQANKELLGNPPIPLASWATFSCKNIMWTTAILIEFPILASAKILDTCGGEQRQLWLWSRRLNCVDVDLLLT